MLSLSLLNGRSLRSLIGIKAAELLRTSANSGRIGVALGIVVRGVWCACVCVRVLPLAHNIIGLETITDFAFLMEFNQFSFIMISERCL